MANLLPMLKIRQDYKSGWDCFKALISSQPNPQEEEKAVISEEKQRSSQNDQGGGILKKFLNDLVGDISIAADKLESELNDDAFETGLHSNQKFNVETVIKVSGEESSGMYTMINHQLYMITRT